MGMIDLDNFDKLPPEMQKQFAELLKQHPQLESKMKGASHELNTPTKMSDDSENDPNVVDYSSIGLEEDTIAAKPKSSTPTLRVSAEPTNEEIEKEEKKAKVREKKQKQAEAASALKQPEEVANFSPEGKQHPVLKKLRASLGLGTLQKPFVAEVGGMKYEMLPLTRDSMTKSITTAALHSRNDAEFRANQDIAIVAFSIQKLDSVPLADVFSISTVEQQDDKMVPVSDIQRREQAAIALFHELKDSPPELADTLITYYQQEFPPKDLIGVGKTTAHCPTANCTYTRIIDETEESYCPYHGSKLASEGQLPNPF